MKEAEAKEKRCPFGKEMGTILCMGSQCMAWRFYHASPGVVPPPAGDGFCQRLSP